jgi:hypothetical protein
MRRTIRHGSGGGPKGYTTRGKSTLSTNGAYQMQFRLDWDDEALIQAINKLGLEGERHLKTALKAAAQVAIERTQEKLRKMAGALVGVTVPPTWGEGPSKNIYVTLANALRQDDVPGQSHIRVHSGTSFEKAHKGRVGSRGMNLSLLVAEGHKPYKYPHYLPDMVRSSAAYYKKTGFPGDFTMGMMKKGTHPGFKKTFDYMKVIDRETTKEFQKNAKDVVKAAGLASGFGVN